MGVASLRLVMGSDPSPPHDRPTVSAAQGHWSVSSSASPRSIIVAMALGSLIWGVALSLAAVSAWSIGTPLAWAAFAMLLALFVFLAAVLQLRR
jgi:hypothetical protein